MAQKLVELEETADGLYIRLTKEGKDEINSFVDKTEMDALYELTEYQWTNGMLQIVSPEEIGALTDAPILSTDYEYVSENTDDKEYHNIFWFPNYCIQSVIEILKNTGSVFFNREEIA